MSYPSNPFSKQEDWTRLVEYAIRKEKSNELTVTCGWFSKEKMRTELKFSKLGPQKCL